MKIRYTFALPLLALSLSGTGQTLDLGNSAPVVGDNFVQHRGAYVSPGSAGAAQTWNLSGLQSTTSSPVAIVAPTSTPQGSSFPAATVAASSDGSNYAYLKTSAAGLEYVGTYGASIVMAYQNPEMLLKYPCAYNTTWTDPWSSNFETQGFSVTRAGSSTGVADGHGTLIMPYGTFNNVLRVKFTQTYTDNIAGMSTVNYSATTYYFYKPGIHMAIAQTSSITSTSGGNSQTDTFAAWLDASSVGIREAMGRSIGIEVFPNPAVDQATLVFSGTGGAITWEVTDAMGRLVGTGRMPTSPGIMRHSLDLGSYSPGLYHIRLIDTEGNQGVQRLVVE